MYVDKSVKAHSPPTSELNVVEDYVSEGGSDVGLFGMNVA